MNTEFTHDIIISGGGMVGLSLAAACAKYGLRVALIEKNTPTGTDPNAKKYSPRVSAINHASERFLTNIGAWQHIPSNRMSAYSGMHVWDGLGQGAIDFNAHSVQQGHLGHIIENCFITDALWQTVNGDSNIDVVTSDTITNWHQDDKKVQIETEQGLSFCSQILVASEGKHSPIREATNIESWQWPYDHTAIVATVRHQKKHNKTAQQVFLDSGPLAFLPLESNNPEQQYSSIVWSVKSSQAQAILDMPDSDFLKALNSSFENRLGDLEKTDPRFSFPLSAQQAKTYFDNRVVILGDSAHTIHPLAGLGVNLGFLDAATLADSWQKASAKKTDLSHRFVLSGYQRQRQVHNLAVAGLMEGLKRLFDTQSAIPVLLRNTGLSIVNSNPILKRPFVLGALGDMGTALPDLCR